VREQGKRLAWSLMSSVWSSGVWLILFRPFFCLVRVGWWGWGCVLFSIRGPSRGSPRAKIVQRDRLRTPTLFPRHRLRDALPSWVGPPPFGCC